MAHGRKKAPAGYRWKTVTVPGSRPKSFTTKHVLVPIEGAEEVSVDAPALDMFNVPAPITQAYGPHPGQAVDPNVDRTPVPSPRAQNLLNMYDKFDPRGGVATRSVMGDDPTFAGVTERHVRDIAGLANTQKEWDAQQRARNQRLPPALVHAMNRGDTRALLAGGDIIGKQSGLDPRTAVGPMAGPVRRVLSNLANATKKAVITPAAKKTVDKATTDLGKRIRGEVQETVTRTGRSTVPTAERIKLEAAKTQARKEGFPPMTATEVFTPRTSRLGGQNVLRTTPEVSRLLKEGPTPGRTTRTPPVSQDFQRTSLYNTGLSLKDRIAAQVEKGTAVAPRRSLATTTKGSPLAERIRADRTLTAASDAARTRHPSVASGNVLRSRIAQDVAKSKEAAKSGLTLEQRIAAQVRDVNAPRSLVTSGSSPLKRDMTVYKGPPPRDPQYPATYKGPPIKWTPASTKMSPAEKALAAAASVTALGVGAYKALDDDVAKDQTQAAIDAVEDTGSGPLRGTAGTGGVSQDIGKLPKVGKGSDADQIATNPNLEKIWGKYAYDPKARAKKFNEGMNSIWRKMALLNAIAVMTGNESMAPAYMKMAMARLDRMDKFDEEARVSSLVKEVFTGPNGEFYMPKNKTEAAERAAKAGGLPATIKEIFGAVPTKPTPKAATGYVTWTDGKKNIPLQKGELGPTGYWVGKAGSEGGGQYERAASKAREHIMLGGEGAQQKAVAELVQYYNSTKDTTGALIFGTDMAEKMATEQLQKILITMGMAEGKPPPSLGDSGVDGDPKSKEEAYQMARRLERHKGKSADELRKEIEEWWSIRNG